jgi:hypothetical protein
LPTYPARHPAGPATISRYRQEARLFAGRTSSRTMCRYSRNQYIIRHVIGTIHGIAHHIDVPATLCGAGSSIRPGKGRAAGFPTLCNASFPKTDKPQWPAVPNSLHRSYAMPNATKSTPSATRSRLQTHRRCSLCPAARHMQRFRCRSCRRHKSIVVPSPFDATATKQPTWTQMPRLVA